jgi:hypothetical protein
MAFEVKVVKNISLDMLISAPAEINRLTEIA